MHVFKWGLYSGYKLDDIQFLLSLVMFHEHRQLVQDPFSFVRLFSIQFVPTHGM